MKWLEHDKWEKCASEHVRRLLLEKDTMWLVERVRQKFMKKHERTREKTYRFKRDKKCDFDWLHCKQCCLIDIHYGENWNLYWNSTLVIFVLFQKSKNCIEE